MTPLLQILLLGLLAGAAIPVGGWLARIESFGPRWLENEFRHFVIAFGGGALLSAVALVLVPEGSKDMPVWLVALCFGGGGLIFLGIDLLIARSKSSASQLVAMLSDYLPEALALGAFVADGDSGILLAFLIALQNLPEGFNSFREMNETLPANRILIVFMLIALLGPLTTWLGFTFLSGFSMTLQCLMLIAGGGILYIIFQDIAPQAKLKKHWVPTLGAVIGFLLGLIGHLLTT
jgi:ZIP family zinc transporter